MNGGKASFTKIIANTEEKLKIHCRKKDLTKCNI